MRDDTIALLVFFIAALIVTLVTLYFRYRKQQLLHQERMASLEKGMPIPKAYTPVPWSPRLYLLRGLLWSCAGIALSVSLLGIAISTQRPLSATDVSYRAANLSSSAAISFKEAKQIIEQEQKSRKEGMPSGVALLGLIPLGVGVAYLIFYNTGDKSRLDSHAQTPEP
jgi:hypothetical protein